MRNSNLVLMKHVTLCNFNRYSTHTYLVFQCHIAYTRRNVRLLLRNPLDVHVHVSRIFCASTDFRQKSFQTMLSDVSIINCAIVLANWPTRFFNKGKWRLNEFVQFVKIIFKIWQSVFKSNDQTFYLQIIGPCCQMKGQAELLEVNLRVCSLSFWILS